MTLRWPHEAAIKTPSLNPYLESITEDWLTAYRLRRCIRVAPEPLRSALWAVYQHHFFRMNNGDCPYVEGKYQFTQIVRELGYLAPDSAVIMPGARPLHRKVRRLDAGSDRRFCKPLSDSYGRGLHVAETPLEALVFARAQGRPYLVQSFMPPVDGEWRYILHRTTADLAAGGPPSIRIAIRKCGPVVVGDGRSSVTRLIETQRRWSDTDKAKLLIAAPSRVPAKGERVELVNSGNVSRRLNGFAFPEPAALARIDTVMLEFLAAYEGRIGGTLATTCVDIGLTPAGPVFYELQFPFGNTYGLPGGTGARHLRHNLRFAQSVYYGAYATRSPR